MKGSHHATWVRVLQLTRQTVVQPHATDSLLTAVSRIYARGADCVLQFVRYNRVGLRQRWQRAVQVSLLCLVCC